MTQQQAERLAEFVKDHDKRFEAKAKTDRVEGSVLLTLVSDGTVLEPILQWEQYEAQQIWESDPGPTVVTAWEQWRTHFQGG